MAGREVEADGPSEAALAKAAAGPVATHPQARLVELAHSIGNRAFGDLVARRTLARAPWDFDEPGPIDEADPRGRRRRRTGPRFGGSTQQLHEDVYGDSSMAHAPGPRPVPRIEVTAFGTWNIVADGTMGPLLPDQITNSDFLRLERAWDRINDGTGGLTTNGSAADKATLFRMFGEEMARSRTFRDVIIEITEDRAHPVTINVGRDTAYWIDEFATNNVDLNDIDWFERGPVANYTWVQTRGEIMLHWLVERRFAAVNGGAFAAAHAHPLAAGGRQEQYRTDLGQAGRVTSQTRTDLGGGLEEGRYTDTNGNMTLIRRDASAGDPVVYEMEYRPAAPTAAAPGLTRVNHMIAQLRVGAAAPLAAGDRLFVRFVGATRSASAPEQVVAAGAGATFDLPLSQIVPVGGPVTVEVWRKPAAGANVRVLSLNWAHPFGVTSSPAGAFEVTVRLERR